VKVSFGICVYENAEAIASAIESCLVPSLRLAAEAEVLCVDNSRAPSPLVETALAETGIPSRYEWSGRNLRYAATLNRLVRRASHPYFVYVCLAHCEMRDPSWWKDLVAPLEDPAVGITGCRQDGPWEFPAEHIQGGIFAARTEVLRALPFSPGFPHDFSDIAMSRQLGDEGYRVVDVPAIRNRLPGSPSAEGAKILHRSRPRGRTQRLLRFLRHGLTPLEVVPVLARPS